MIDHSIGGKVHKMRKTSLFLLLISIFTLSCSQEKNIPAEKWEILYSEEKNPQAAAQNTAWEKFSIPQMFTHTYRPERRFHRLWLRATFTITDNPEEYQGISLGRLYYLDTTYINGIEVGKYEKEDYGNGHFPRNYHLPSGLLKKGKNTLYIYLGIYGREYGGLSRNAELLRGGDFHNRKASDDVIYRQIPTGIVIFLLGQIVFNLIFLIRRMNTRINSVSALLCASLIFYIILIYSPWSFPGPDLRITLLWSCTAFVPIFYLKMVQAFYRVELTSLNRVAIPLFLAAFLSIIINPDTVSSWYLGRISGAIILFLAAGIIFYAIYHGNRLNPGNIFYVLIFFGIFPGLFIAWDIVNYLWIFHYPPLTHTYTLPLFIVGMMVLIVDETIKKEITLDQLYRELKNDTAQARDTVVTATTEEKLKRVQDFLTENYCSDISREGLADAMDMSPDHMSRMFKAHTGKKINDFINELRVKDAAISLIETDERITDIAFNVGFESLATFNRAFLKITGLSPTQYRKDKK